MAITYVKVEAMLTGSPTKNVTVGNSYSGGTIGAKDRGDYEPAEDGNFGDLW